MAILLLIQRYGKPIQTKASLIFEWLPTINGGGGSQKAANKTVSYFPVECWEKLAENCTQYLRKGSRVTIQGELREDRWKDQNGKNCSQLKIVARSVRFDQSPNSKKQATTPVTDDLPQAANG